MAAGRNRAARRVVAHGLLLGALVAEKKYVRQLRALMRGLHKHFEDQMIPHLPTITHAGAGRQDAVGPHTKWKKSLDGLWTTVESLRNAVPAAFDPMAKTVAQRNFEATKVLLGVTPSQSRVAEHIAVVRQQNIDLIVKAGRSYADDVQEIFGDPDSFGMSIEELKQRLLDRGSVSESRAELIARDQTLKLNGQLNEIRQTNAGVRRYTWSTSGDERVRASHADLDGQEFEWSSPPLIDGEPCDPGDDIMCRCVAIPVVDFGEEDDED